MRLLALTALGVSILCHGIDDTAEKIINPFTRDVYYRYYLIKRCQEPIQLLKSNAAIWNNINFDLLNAELIDNDEIKQKVIALQKNHLIEPFLALWHQMISHRHVNDTSFHKDFIKLIFMLYKSLEHPTLQKTSASSDLHSIATMLNSIDKHLDSVRGNTPKRDPQDYALPESNLVSTDDIALNYYLIQRLDKSIKLLSQIHDECASSLKGSFDQSICNTGINFSHDRINYCLNQMIIRKNLEPILHTWHEFSRFRHAGDAHFLKEMLMMLFSVYKDLLLVKFGEESEEIITTEMNTILDLYEHINELPLDEILQAIDLTTDKLLLLQGMEKKVKQGWSEQYPILFHTLLALPIAYLIVKACAL